MRDAWDPTEAAALAGPLEEVAYASRLIGREPALVLHGGGNSSVKVVARDIVGRDVEVLHVKGSGWDMASIEPAGFTALRLAHLRDLLTLDALDDPAMMRELAAAKLDPGQPAPSVETLLHALLPQAVALHSHADAIVALTNTAAGERLVHDVLGGRVVVVPYVMPGYRLARHVRDLAAETTRPGVDGLVLVNHGLFTFGETASEAYRRHVELITAVETWLDEQRRDATPTTPPRLPAPDPAEIADVRAAISRAAGRPMIVTRDSDAEVARFVARRDLAELATRGPLTPDHVIHTRRVPLVGRDVEGYGERYRATFAAHRGRLSGDPEMLDPAPRVVLDPALGMLTAGPTAARAAIVADIFRHTAAVMERAEDELGGYVGLGEAEAFDMEYWALERAKLATASNPPELAGQVAIVSGAASGIGRASAAALLGRGAAVVGVDRAAEVVAAFDGPAWLGVVADVTDDGALGEAFRAGVERFGGFDIVVIAAGVFGRTVPIAEADPAEWDAVMRVNLDGALAMLRHAHPLLVRSPAGGRVVVVGSRNAAAPGRGVGAYSASKAALTQLARVTALEWAADGIRVNVVHPDAVFDTGLWTPEVLAARAGQYGLTVDEYRRRNLLGREITSADVGRLVAELCGDAFVATTGAQIPIDGGNERVI
ncbi:MAG TPA: bifunctional aldolase/short-chain dehydrogenase [Candidatus Limnocylindrales bacterium]|nr:bifunctional aldolase/short-chain dehydrogenase [Candidatus Limnocylindrales bacterium]